MSQARLITRWTAAPGATGAAGPDIEGQRLEHQLTQGELVAAGTSARER